MDPALAYDHYRRIQLALGHAIRKVHLTRTQVPTPILESIRAELVKHEWIFTTSYDLQICWAMSCGPDRGRPFAPFLDHFRWGNRGEFDPERSPVEAHEVRGAAEVLAEQGVRLAFLVASLY